MTDCCLAAWKAMALVNAGTVTVMVVGEPHGGIVTGHAGQAIVGRHDPDGIEIRLYTPDTGATA